jgi:hypothetical protein
MMQLLAGDSIHTSAYLLLALLPCSTHSLSHTTHKPHYSVEQPQTTALMKEQTRIRTMGFPRKVEVKGFAHTATKTAAASAAAASAGHAGMMSQTQEAAAACGAACTGGSSSSGGATKKAGKPSVKASEMIDTLSSKVPLKWAASSVVVPGSSYTAAFGSNPGRSPQVKQRDTWLVSSSKVCVWCEASKMSRSCQTNSNCIFLVTRQVVSYLHCTPELSRDNSAARHIPCRLCCRLFGPHVVYANWCQPHLARACFIPLAQC